MKTFIKSITALAMLLAWVACEKEGDKIYLESLEAGQLIASEQQVILSSENRNQQVLSLAWSAHHPSVSDPSVSAPPVVSNELQVSLTETFDSYVASNEASLSKAYTGSELNALAKNLNATPDVANTFYFRVGATTGANIAAVYSQVKSVQVTPYTIDMSIGFVLDGSKADTGVTLASIQEDGIYTGFMGATSWYNYFLLEGDGNLWGNDGVKGDPFLMSDESTHWNFWFPGFGGCYFVEVNTPNKVWSALYIPELTVSGDLTGAMTFDRPSRQWRLNFTATQVGTLSIALSGAGKLYNHATSTDDDAAIDTPVAFGGSSNQLTFGQTAQTIAVEVTQTGDVTLILDLTDPKAWKVGVEAGVEEPELLLEELFLVGIDDLLTDGWNFDTKVTLYDEEREGYVGVAYAASEWGYGLFTEEGNWDDKYTFTEGDAYAGSMEFKGAGGNLPAPQEGLYLFQAWTKALTYKLTALGSEIYYTGLSNGTEDDWSLHTMQATGVTGEYQATMTIIKPSDWGFQLVLDSGWEHKYGGSQGVLYYQGENFKEDATLEPGNYIFTVNLVARSYSIVAQ